MYAIKSPHQPGGNFSQDLKDESFVQTFLGSDPQKAAAARPRKYVMDLFSGKVLRHLRTGPALSSNAFFLVLLLASLSRLAVAQECNTVPIATDDEVFHDGKRMIIDVLANDVEPVGELLTIHSVTTTCDASVSEDFGLVLLIPTMPRSEACQIDYQVADAQGETASATVFVRDIGVIFNDGFESGDTSAWPDVEP